MSKRSRASGLVACVAVLAALAASCGVSHLESATPTVPTARSSVEPSSTRPSAPTAAEAPGEWARPLIVGQTTRSSVGPARMSAEDGRGANLETACHAGCLDQVPLRTVPVGLHVVSLEAGEYTLELMPVSATDDACGFGLERAFPVPEGDTPEAWAEALERGLGGAGACGDGSGRVRNLLVIPEPGEYLLAIVERVDFRRYPPDARQGVCGQYEVTLVSGYHWCSSE